MNKILKFILVITTLNLLSCERNKPNANLIIEHAIQAHGSNKLKNSETTFSFRNIAYRIKRNSGNINFTRTFVQNGDTIKDIKTKTGTTRYLNDSLQVVADSLLKKYDSSINSVAYFAQLPYSLDGPAVIKTYLGEATILGKEYHEIQVTFKEDGGGDAYDDVFVYWVNTQSHLIDYLAYSYCEADCGSRFRESVNRTNHQGIIMQDYKNYKSQMQEPKLQDMDDLFKQGKLELLSEIVNEDVTIVIPAKK